VAYINVGTRWNGNLSSVPNSSNLEGRFFKSKAALKLALASNPMLVYFESTALMGESFNGNGEDVCARLGSNTLSVCGPDPHRSRKWYANIKVINGKLKIT